MNPFVSTLVLLAGLTQTPSRVDVSAANYPMAAIGAVTVTESASEPQVYSSMALSPGSSMANTADIWDQAREAVLVIPTPDLPPESLVNLTDDLTVMCRIFDKFISAPRSGVGLVYGSAGDLWHTYGMRQRSRETQGLYLDGYGAVFFIDVDYPLVPTETQEQSSSKPTESTDSVWSRTLQEMNGQPTEGSQPARGAPAYDPLRVENLRKTLVQHLAHASNIRMRRPQDVITLAVGDLDASSRPTTSSVQAFSTNGRVRSSVTQRRSSSSVAARNPASALLVLRTTKADVDAFAKGQLTLVQFTDKIQSLWSPPDQATPATAPAPTTGARR